MKQFTSLLLFITLFCCQKTISQKNKENTLTSDQSNSLSHVFIQQKTDEIFDSLVSIRRDFHIYPELSGQEERTSKKIEQYLVSLGLEVKTNIGGFGVVGILNGAKKGKKIAWRADIDAMPSNMLDVVDFKSKNEGVRHICGHDVHTTVALGIANVLASQKENIEGTIYFVFQPSEENLKGAEAMIDDGLFNIINPDEIYALHMSPFPAGTIATKSKGLFADYKRLNITIKKTNNSKALIDFTKTQILNLQNIESESKFWNMMNMGDPEIGIAGPNTIYKDYTIINGNINVKEINDKISLSAFLSSSDKKQQDLVIPYLKKQFSNSEYLDELLNIEYVSETPTILNDDTLASETLENLSSIYGNERVIPLTGIVADGRSDDFALFQQKVPGVYFFLGGSNYETGIISQPHSPGFAVDESCIKTGVQFFSSMIMERLGNK